MLSEKFKTAVWLSDKPQWKIAQEAGVAESVLSRFMNGRDKAKPGDERLQRVADIIGYSGEIFEG